MAAFGGTYAGKADAIDDVVQGRPAQCRAALARAFGIPLLVAGGLTLIATTSFQLHGVLTCETIGCVRRATIVGIAGSGTGASVGILGAGLTGYGVSYRRTHVRWARPSIAAGPTSATLTIAGRF